MKTFFMIMGIIYTSLISIAIILWIIQQIINRYNINLFKKHIANNDDLKKTFDKLDDEKLKELKKGKKVEETTFNYNEDNTKTMMNKFKSVEIKNIDTFISKLVNYLRKSVNVINCTIKDWYTLKCGEEKTETLFTFEVHGNNIFLVIAHNCDKGGKVVTNICGFDSIESMVQVFRTIEPGYTSLSLEK